MLWFATVAWSFGALSHIAQASPSTSSPRGSAPAAPSGYDLDVIVDTDDPDPEAPPSIFSGAFFPWGFNRRGQVLFSDMTYNDKPDSTVWGTFLFDNDQIRSVVRESRPAPDGGVFGAPESASLNDAGDFSFTSQKILHTSPTGYGWGVYRYLRSAGAIAAVLAPNVTRAPNGSAFVGAAQRDSINSQGTVVFSGIYPSTEGYAGPLAQGTFLATADGKIVSAISPGDPAPGGGKFDFAYDASINDDGDVAVAAHERDDECIGNPNKAYTADLYCGGGLYVRRADGSVKRLVHPNDPAPGGGKFSRIRGPRINKSGNIVFEAFDAGVIYLYRRDVNQIVVVARPGDPMPGGGNLLLDTFTFPNWTSHDINASNEIVFRGEMKISEGVFESGVFLWSSGTVRLVGRTGTAVATLGTIDHVVGLWRSPRLLLNARGEVVFPATVAVSSGYSTTLVHARPRL